MPEEIKAQIGENADGDKFSIVLEPAYKEEEEETEETEETAPAEEASNSYEDEEESRSKKKGLSLREGNVERASFPLEIREATNTSDRTLTMSVSSESPVQRTFGNEILGHRDGEVRLSRLLRDAPLLLNHNTENQIGVVENATLDSDQGRLLATVRFGESELASDIFRDVQTGIRKNVSIGYQIHNMERSEDETSQDVRVTDWEAYEVSVVSVPADNTVGFDRGLNLGRSQSLIDNLNKEKKMSEENKTDNSVDLESEIRTKVSEEMKQRKNEIAEILEIGARHNKSDLARKAVEDDVSLSAFRGQILTELENTPIEKQEIGLNDQEKREFSIVRAAKAKAGMISREEAAFELEASEAYSKKIRKETQGFFIPEDVTNDWGQRTMNTANSSSFVYTDKQYGNLIDALTPFSTILQANPTSIPGNTGNIVIPRVSALSTVGWVTEGNDVNQSDPTLDSITLDEKTVGAATDLTRSLLQNTDGFAIEQMVRTNLLRATAVGIDDAALNGTGAAGQPTGLLNVAGVNAVAFGVAGSPTYAELIECESAILADNKALDGGSVAVITTPALNGYAKSLATNGAGSPVAQRDGFIDGRRVLISSQVAANKYILGDFSEFIVATWAGGIEVEADPYALFKSGGLRLRVLTSLDFGVKHPVSFAIGA
tara:strand:- start:19627 stop:21606 length:1980 start_codon:yes stop_codon:yes gene_type:complete